MNLLLIVASIWKMNVANEANAMTMDGIIAGEILPTIKNAAGYVGAQRMVCKSEWAYELIFEFDSLDNFKAWKGSAEYEALMKKTPDNLSKIGVTLEEAYNGARVIDNFGKN